MLSLAGRDKGRLLAIVESREDYVLVCDGKERPLQRPKRKNISHLKAMNIRLEEEAFRGNRALQKALAAAENAEEGKLRR